MVDQSTKPLLKWQSQLFILVEERTVLIAGQIHELQLAASGWANPMAISSTWNYSFLPLFTGTTYAIHGPALI